MATVVAKWGNSLAIRLPVEVTNQVGIKAGDRVEISAGQDGYLTISPVRPQYSLDSLVDQITTENVHEAADWGERRGSEVW